MTFVVSAVVLPGLLVWVIFIWLRGWLFNSCLIALIMFAYCSGYLQTLVPVRFIIALFAALLLVTLSATKISFLKPSEKVGIFTSLGFFVLIFTAFLSFVEAIETDPLFRYTLLFPLILSVGFFVAKAQAALQTARAYVAISSIMGLLSVIERVNGTFFVAGTYASSDRLYRDGSIRSIVFSEHPLVLSVLLLASVPLVASTLKTRAFRVLVYAALVGGIVCTNSRGALILLAIWIIIAAASNAKILRPGASKLARFTAIVGVAAGFLWMLVGSGPDELSSSSAVDASAEYRTSLYSFAARSLLEMPWGWGISSLPEGIYLVSSYFGTLDIAKTVDSELALAVFDFGWLGLIAFTGLIFVQLSARRLSSPFGQAAIIVTLSGFYLALHAWVGLGTVWMLLIGLSLGASSLRGLEKRESSFSD